MGLTSNEGAYDFQYITNCEDEYYVHQTIINKVKTWGNIENTMFVVGATKASNLKAIRQIIPEHFLLIPGVGAQGGSLNDVVFNGYNTQCGLIVNSSRNIIYADNSEKFAETAQIKAQEVQLEMAKSI